MPQVTFRSSLQLFTVDVPKGTTLLKTAEACGGHIGHACGGVCACSTCHVWVQQGLESLPEPDEMELDRLEQAFDVRPNSRLACQTAVQDTNLDVWITEESLKAYMNENPDIRNALAAQGKWPR